MGVRLGEVLFHKRPNWSLNPSCGYLLNAEMHNWNKHIEQLEELQHWFPTMELRDIMGRAKWKPLEFSLPMQILNQKQYHIPGGSAEIGATIKT